MNNLFKGYVPTKGKKCLKKFKDRTSKELDSYDDVKNLDEYAGVLNDNIVLIDIDDFKQSEILFDIVKDLKLQCRVYETTRGKHFLFTNDGKISKCSTHIKLAISLESDIKIGSKNSYSILKYNNKNRKILYDTKEYGSLPYFLVPVASKYEFFNLGEGDGRNQKLFEYILVLQSNDFNKDEIQDCLHLINKYVFKESLEESELETILRDIDEEKCLNFYDKKRFMHEKFAEYLVKENNIIRINDTIHTYVDGVYLNNNLRIERQMYNIIPSLTVSKRTEVLKTIEIIVNENTTQSNEKYIAFKNGIYNIETDELIDFTHDIIITNKLNVNYNPDAYNSLVDKTLDKLSVNDIQIRKLLEECIGYCFYRRNELRKCFLLTGEKRNGKSTFLSLINKILGSENISTLDLKELGERFKTAELFGKLANVGDDIDDDFITSTAIFKKLVSGNPVNVERKGANPFDFENYAKLIFSANEIPKMKDKSGAVLDRLIIVPFNATFDKNDDDYDPFIKDKLSTDDALEYLALLGVKALKRILKNQEFTHSSKVEEELKEYQESIDNITYYLNYTDINDFIDEEITDCYDEYKLFCLNNSFIASDVREFSKRVVKYYNLVSTRYGRKQTKIYRKK